MTTTIPRITVTANDGGWLATCTCGDWLAWHTRRPAVDLAARTHQGSHQPKTGDRT